MKQENQQRSTEAKLLQQPTSKSEGQKDFEVVIEADFTNIVTAALTEDVVLIIRGKVVTAGSINKVAEEDRAAFLPALPADVRRTSV